MKNIDRIKHRLLYRARMVVNGERRCKYFKTKAAADAQVSLWKVEIMNTVSQEELAELILCRKKLKGIATLTEAVDFFLAHTTTTQAPTIAEGIVQFCEWLEASGRSKVHVASVKTHTRSFVAEFGEKFPCDVTSAALIAWIGKMATEGKKSARTQKNEINAARNFIGWTKVQGWVREVPEIDERILPRQEVKEPEIYTPEEVADIFDWLEENMPAAIPLFAVRAFLGLRTSEALRLTWDDIDMENKMLRVRAKKSKLGIARTLDEELAPDTAFVWLEKYREYDFAISNRQRAKIAKSLKMKDNGFRKSFATMLTSLRKNQQETMMATGHTSMQTLKKHYEAAKQTRSVAEAYFAVLPKKR